jgi:methyl-accepting chemotaxis protein
MAKIDHVLFKKRVVDVLMEHGHWDTKDVPDHHHCRLGKWYDEIKSPGIRKLPAFGKLVEPHERVHAAAKAALTANAAKDKTGALKALSDMSQASEIVLRLLDELSAAIGDEEAAQMKRAG